MCLCGGRVSLVRLRDFFKICLNFYFLHLHVVKLTSCPNGGGNGRFKWLWMRRTRLLVPDGLLVLVFHTLLLIRWDFHRVATVPGGLQFSEKWGKKKKKARWAERNNLVEIKDRKHVPQPATRGRAEFSSQLSLGEVGSLSQCYTDRPASPTNNLDFPTEPATFLRHHNGMTIADTHISPPTDLRLCLDEELILLRSHTRELKGVGNLR